MLISRKVVDGSGVWGAGYGCSGEYDDVTEGD